MPVSYKAMGSGSDARAVAFVEITTPARATLFGVMAVTRNHGVEPQSVRASDLDTAFPFSTAATIISVTSRAVSDETASDMISVSNLRSIAPSGAMISLTSRGRGTSQTRIDELQRAAPIVVTNAGRDAVDGDGHLDVLIGASGRVQVAYGDGTTLAPATPLRVRLGGVPDPTDIEMPLAVGLLLLPIAGLPLDQPGDALCRL